MSSRISSLVGLVKESAHGAVEWAHSNKEKAQAPKAVTVAQTHIASAAKATPKGQPTEASTLSAPIAVIALFTDELEFTTMVPEKPATAVVLAPEKPATAVVLAPEKPATAVVLAPEKPATAVVLAPEKPATMVTEAVKPQIMERPPLAPTETALGGLTKGVMTGIATPSVLTPLDASMAQLSLEKDKKQSLASSAKKTFRILAKSWSQERAWNGVGVRMGTGTTRAGLLFAVYPVAQNHADERFPDHPTSNKMIASLTAACAETGLLSPVGAIETRMLGLKQTFPQVWRELPPGCLAKTRNLYTGISATALRNIPYTAIWLTISSLTRESILSGEDPSFVRELSASTTASAFGAIIGVFATCPADVIRTRIIANAKDKPTIRSTVRFILQTEGVGGLYKTLGLGTARMAVAAGLAGTCGGLINIFMQEQKPTNT